MKRFRLNLTRCPRCRMRCSPKAFQILHSPCRKGKL